MSVSSKLHGSSLYLGGALCCAIVAAGPARAASDLGAAGNFAVLAASAITNTGATTINGDIGVAPGLAIAGADSILQTGTSYGGGAMPAQAAADAVAAWATLTAPGPATDLSGQDLGTIGMLTPGTYSFASSAQLTGNLTLDFAGHPDMPFVFLIGSTLTTASGSNVAVLGGSGRSGIYWLVGSSATLGTTTSFAGNIIAQASVTLNSAAQILCGRAIALAGAVTLDGNSVSNSCSGAGALGSGRSDFGSAGFSAGGSDVTAALPEPASWALLLAGFGGIGAVLRRRRGAVAA